MSENDSFKGTEKSAENDSSNANLNSVNEFNPQVFAQRHIGPRAHEIAEMLGRCGLNSLDELIETSMPASIRDSSGFDLPAPASEHSALNELRALAGRNTVFKSFTGMGYHASIMPAVIKRNILENPGWYTAYTPYQAEIAQGRLEALLNFQTMISDLTGMAVANASLLDEPTAAAEAVTMCHGMQRKNRVNKVFVSALCHPQTINVVKTRCAPLGIEVEVGDHSKITFETPYFAVLLQYPATNGEVEDFSELVNKAHEAAAKVIIAADLLSLTMLKPPGEFDADMVVGTTQRFGLPMGFGGPHAAFFATRDKFKRQMPGRLIGVSRDAMGRPAVRLALQTREQHIRRERATSNICTAQVLPAVLAAMYAVYHGPEGLKYIARQIADKTARLAASFGKLGLQVINDSFFDTISIKVEAEKAQDILDHAAKSQVNLRLLDSTTLSVSLNETTTDDDLDLLLRIFNCGEKPPVDSQRLDSDTPKGIPTPLERTTTFLTHTVFNRYHSETEMMRYLHRLESRDLSLTTSMIPLGSCTMKLNSAASMEPITWPEFSLLHPYAPKNQAAGYHDLFNQLSTWLQVITGLPAVSLQPNAGSQGEYAGLLAIRNFHLNNNGKDRDICLIPQSAHGTNPASSAMAGMKVISVACDEQGNIDIADLKSKASENASRLAAIMITYPSTHGVYEEQIKDVCKIIHEHGGQVYMDGANMNALTCICKPSDIGADVCHLNLHKTFGIPHGGGGPGMAPITAAAHLEPFLPANPIAHTSTTPKTGPISATAFGSASILPISWMYIRMLGQAGMKLATQVSVLNANYIARELDDYYPVLYKGANGYVAHECILDFRQYKSVSIEDVAKRLMDFGFHAPTISFPVPGTLMVEPTESESKAELDRFCEAMISIHKEIIELESAQVEPEQSPLKNAPHTAEAITAENWTLPYTREHAVFPRSWVRENKFWPACSRIDNVYGDRKPVCSCSGMDELDG
ncbi:MAG: aminomethyl-transferring glycine dehydrogenase [Verrucomicrobia bacterium]|nr:aminomethyl-transferring glycine dehydrogenase [Verrucomicrobiota bacterium]